MTKRTLSGMPLLLMAVIILLSGAAGMLPSTASASAVAKNMIFDEAGLLTEAERQELNELANRYAAERQTDIIIYTTSNPDNEDVQKLMGDFYDEQGFGYDRTHGNAVLFTQDTRNRDIYLAGFYKAEETLDSARLDRIRDRMIPYLSADDYAGAYREFIESSYRYMGIRPGVNPDNPLFNIWVQLAGALVIGGVTVGIMVYRSGGRITVNGNTYQDRGTSGVLDREDRYIRTTVTRRKIEKKSSGGGGGGGGMTGGGHSHSGSRGSY